MISAEPWNGLQMSKHHLAEALAERGNRVLWLDPPLTGVGPTTIRKDGAVERISYHHWLRGINRLPIAIQRWYHGTLLNAIERCVAGRVDIVWSFDTSRMTVFPRADRLFIFHPVDIAVLDAGPGTARRADLIFTSSEVIFKRARQLAPDVAAKNLGHALPPHWLQVATARNTDTTRKRPVATCAGNMSIRFLDWEVLHTEARDNPGADFRFVGPFDPLAENPWFRSIRKLPNVTFIGPLSKEQMVPELRSADVLLLCYRADLWPEELANPHKLLEYLSTGNVIVASATSEYAGTAPSLLRMAIERWEHPALLAQVLNDLEHCNATGPRQARMELARSHTINSQLDLIERTIQSECR